MFVYVLSLCVFLSCVSAFCFRCIVCCSMAWVCVVLVRLNVLLKSMCVSFVLLCFVCLCYPFVVFCAVSHCLVHCLVFVCLCALLNMFVRLVCELLCEVV